MNEKEERKMRKKEEMSKKKGREEEEETRSCVIQTQPKKEVRKPWTTSHERSWSSPGEDSMLPRNNLKLLSPVFYEERMSKIGKISDERENLREYERKRKSKRIWEKEKI